MTTTTKLMQMVDPQVMADMISAGLADKIKFSPLAEVDTTLQGRPGSTLTVPKFEYIGPAIDVAEGVAIDPTQMTTSSTDFTIKKAGKAVEITDEAILSGLGDPLGEAQNQLVMSIADKIDDDIVTALDGATLTNVSAGAKWDLDLIADTLDLFEDEDDEDKVLVMHPLDASELRKSIAGEWTRASELGDRIITTGVYGAVLDAQIIRSRRCTQGVAYVVKRGALKVFMKRNVQVESDRDILSKTTVISADEHYGVYLYDESKAVKIDVTPAIG